MTKRKSKNNISDKIAGIIIGIAITLSAVGIISAVSVSSAYTGRNFGASGMMGDGVMSGDMSMMHSMMMSGDGSMMSMMECMKMMNQATSDEKITQEEMENMMQQMDKDGDGNCDYCGMSIEACRRTISS